MPEGDTVHKLARAIAPRLEGQRLERFELAGDRTLDLAGRRVERVTARGKHLLVRVEGDLVLRTHLGMHGSWHRYARDERWQRPPRQASLVLGTPGDVFVCFNARASECLRAEGARARDVLGRLGPDLAADESPDGGLLVRRARRLAEAGAPVADALLQQRVASGIGNVYKSEVLFLHGVHPARPLGEVDDATLGALFATARTLLRRNLHGGRRATRTDAEGGGLWVYGRRGGPCARCGTPVEATPIGRGRRITYWCPGCQPAA